MARTFVEIKHLWGGINLSIDATPRLVLSIPLGVSRDDPGDALLWRWRPRRSIPALGRLKEAGQC